MKSTFKHVLRPNVIVLDCWLNTNKNTLFAYMEVVLLKVEKISL